MVKGTVLTAYLFLDIWWGKLPIYFLWVYYKLIISFVTKCNAFQSVLKMASGGILFIWQPYFLHVNASWGFDRLTICEWGGTLWCRTAGTDKLWLTSVTFRLQDRIATKPTLHSCCKIFARYAFIPDSTWGCLLSPGPVVPPPPSSCWFYTKRISSWRSNLCFTNAAHSRTLRLLSLTCYVKQQFKRFQCFFYWCTDLKNSWWLLFST